ncbi:MAG: hypothetical protein PHY80_02675 [Rickettsiales bacterium]|nr:hypothetical protein [Rickettsiales bacterium]
MKLKMIAVCMLLILGACSSKHDIYEKSKCACNPLVNYADINQIS